MGSRKESRSPSCLPYFPAPILPIIQFHVTVNVNKLFSALVNFILVLILYLLEYKTFIINMVCQYFLLSFVLSLHSLKVAFEGQKFLILMKFNLLILLSG